MTSFRVVGAENISRLANEDVVLSSKPFFSPLVRDCENKAPLAPRSEEGCVLNNRALIVITPAKLGKSTPPPEDSPEISLEWDSDVDEADEVSSAEESEEENEEYFDACCDFVRDSFNLPPKTRCIGDGAKSTVFKVSGSSMKDLEMKEALGDGELVVKVYNNFLYQDDPIQSEQVISSLPKECFKCLLEPKGYLICETSYDEDGEEIPDFKWAKKEDSGIKLVENQSIAAVIYDYARGGFVDEKATRASTAFLSHRIDEAKDCDFSTNEIQKILQSVLEALKTLKEVDIVHLDIKQGAVAISAGDGPIYKLADFDTVRNCRESVELDEEEEPPGTPGYMSPETFLDKIITPTSDIWAVGVVAFELLSNMPLFSKFKGETSVRMGYKRICENRCVLYKNRLKKRVEKLTPESEFLKERFPSEVDRINACDFINKCLQKNPESRPSAADLLEHPLFIEEAMSLRPSPTYSDPRRSASLDCSGLEASLRSWELEQINSSCGREFNTGIESLSPGLVPFKPALAAAAAAAERR